MFAVTLVRALPVKGFDYVSRRMATYRQIGTRDDVLPHNGRCNGRIQASA